MTFLIFLFFLSSICIILRTTQATDAIHSTSATSMATPKESMTPSTTDAPPGGCQKFSRGDTRDPLLNVPWYWSTREMIHVGLL